MVEVRATKNRGFGLFALADFDPGQHIRTLKIVREISPDCPLGQDDDPDHTFFWDGGLLLVGNPDRNLNHSCNPNSYIRSSVFHRNEIDLIARRRIDADDEITLDYLINNPGGGSWKCECGTQRCRGEIAGRFFDLPIEIQREYRPLLASWFVETHRRQMERLDRLLVGDHSPN